MGQTNFFVFSNNTADLIEALLHKEDIEKKYKFWPKKEDKLLKFGKPFIFISLDTKTFLVNPSHQHGTKMMIIITINFFPWDKKKNIYVQHIAIVSTPISCYVTNNRQWVFRIFWSHFSCTASYRPSQITGLIDRRFISFLFFFLWLLFITKETAEQRSNGAKWGVGQTRKKEGIFCRERIYTVWTDPGIVIDNYKNGDNSRSFINSHREGNKGKGAERDGHITFQLKLVR